MVQVFLGQAHWGHDAQDVLAGSTETDKEVLVLQGLEDGHCNVRLQLNAPHQTLAANFNAILESVHDVVQVLADNLAELEGAFLELLFLQHVEHCASGRSADGVGTVGGEHKLASVVEGLEHGLLGDDSGDGETAAQTLGNDDQVRLNTRGLVRPETVAHAPVAGLDFVSDHEAAVLASELGHLVDVLVGELVDATVSLKGLEEESADVSGRAGADGGLCHLNEAIDVVLVVVDWGLKVEDSAGLREVVAARLASTGSHGSAV
mmetsp:Transcript_33194/g.48707  ORF Transcript_33194/g.48707 Transcript_33194/m.48707 type:complete len:263 (+) Transcript_33194:158-946(+)